MTAIYNDEHWMKHALRLAQQSYDNNEVPVGAVVVFENKIIGEGWNQPISTNDPTAHAEIIALRQASAFLKNYRLLNSTLYVTLEPCAMCAGALVYARIDRCVFGTKDPKSGAATSVLNVLNNAQLNHQVEWQCSDNAECAHLLQSFFKARR